MVEPSIDEVNYQEPNHSTANYADYQKPEKPRNPIWKKLGIVAGALVLIAALGAGGYWFTKNRNSSDKPAQTTQTQQIASNAAETITAETKRFDSASFNLSFDYPGNWTASEDNAEEITVLSPGLKLKDIEGKDVTGQIYLRIRAKEQNLTGFDKGEATAVIASEKIAYSSPSQVQRASTFISFIRYAENTQGLDAIYITGDLGYEEGQTVPKTDIEKVDPIISAEFYLCPASGCEGVSGVYGIGAETWTNDNISLPIENILKSLVIN